MSFSFRYKSVILPSGNRMYRPMIPLIIRGVERMNVIAMLDSGSDFSLVPKEIAEELGINYTGMGELSGISGNPIKVKQGIIKITFGKSREVYEFEVPVLVPIEQENVPIIIGRFGFFEQFKISFVEVERRIEFKKVETNYMR